MTSPVRYRAIVADPPWDMEWRGGGYTRRNGRGERHVDRSGGPRKRLPYPTMTVDDICALPVAQVAAPDAHLYLWIPDGFLIAGHAKTVIDAWGFEPGRLIVWRKTGFGLGTFPRPQHECLVTAKRGSLDYRIRDVGSVLDFKFPYEGGVRQHSRKPDGFLDLVERASPGPYLEMFARRDRFGWDTFGDQSLGTGTLCAPGQLAAGPDAHTGD